MWDIKRLFKTEHGFSLVQGMILAGILAGTSLVATRLIQDQKLAQKSAESKDQLNELHKIVFSTLQKNVSCEQTMSSNSRIANIEATNPANPVQVNLPDLNTIMASAGTQPVIQVNNAYMNNGVEVTRIQLIYPLAGAAEAGFGKIRVTYQRLNSRSAQRTKQGYGAKDIAREIRIRVVRNTTTNDFESCYAVSDDTSDNNEDLNETMCKELKIFDWIETHSKCQLKEELQCDAGQGLVYTGISSDGVALCRPLQDWINFNNVFEPSTTACQQNYKVKLQVVGNKVRVVCTP